MLSLSKGRYRTRLARSCEDLRAAQNLRALAFAASGQEPGDSDPFDDVFEHVLVFEEGSDTLVCCYRFHSFASGLDISQSYSAQFYDLSALEGFTERMVEMGRFCLRPGYSDPDILRVAWGGMTAYVDRESVAFLFGCSAFSGTDATPYLNAFALLKDRYIAPKRWTPKQKATDVFDFSTDSRGCPKSKDAVLGIPPLLRSYLRMGAWVSDHAVVDRQMNTLHVFTGLEIAAIPLARKRLLRAVLE